jgi:hypothetical protein
MHTNACLTAVPSFNNRFYAVLSRATNYANAVALAGATTYRGMTGYIATISSYDEYAFVRWGLGAQSLWISGTDASSEGTYKYTIGGATSSTTMSPMHWGIGEPNGGSDEDCIVIGSNGYADVVCTRTDFPDFVVEFECLSPKILFQGACISTLRMFHHVCNAASFHLTRSTSLRQPL